MAGSSARFLELLDGSTLNRAAWWLNLANRSATCPGRSATASLNEEIP